MERRTHHLVDNIELYLTFVGLGLIFTVPVLVDLGSDTMEFAVTAVLVGVVHGVLFWVVRRRQRLVRRRLVDDIREMLRTRVDGKLGEVLANVQPPDRELTPEDRRRLAEVAKAARDIAAAVDAISLETLRPGRR